MSRNSSPFDKQNELIRSLRKQLAATERELAEQKWVFEQFLKSPAWRMTYPARWLVRRLRKLRDGFVRRRGPVESGAVRSGAGTMSIEQDSFAAVAEVALDFRQMLTHLYRVQLETFLTTNASLVLPSSDAPEVSIILVLFNRAELTLVCLRSIAENCFERMETIIVDNNSQDETPALLDRLRGARIIRNAENRNFLLAVNQAAAEARGDYLLLLNNDTQLLPGTLEAALRTIRSAPDIGAVGGRLILLDGTLQEAGSIIWRDGSCIGYGRGDNPSAPMYMFRRDVDYCSGAFLLTPRAVWEKLGGFDETFRPAYYEETDYCARLWKHALRVVYEPQAALLHYEFASSESAVHATDLQRQHQSIFAARHNEMLRTHFAPDLNAILLARMKDRGKRRILFIDDQVPHTWLGSGFPRSRAILLTLVRQNCFVTFYPLTHFNEHWTSVYADMPQEIEFMMGYGPALLEPFLRNRPGYYDAIFVSRPHNMSILKPLVEAHPGWFEQSPVVYDAEAIFAMRQITLRELAGTPMPADEQAALLAEEVGVAAVADTVVAVSKADAEQFRKAGITSVGVIGHLLEPLPTPRPFDERQGFLFVGAIHEEASPNGDSVIWFLEEIFPRIQAELGADVPVTIAGINKSERVRRLAGAPVRIAGHLPDLTKLYDTARVFVAPTRYAAGIPHKVHEAAARGIPIVLTPLLASQLGWQDGDPVLVASGADAFAHKCIELHRDPLLWSRLREAGIQRIRRECSTTAFDASVMECIVRRQKRTGDRRFADKVREAAEPSKMESI